MNLNQIAIEERLSERFNIIGKHTRNTARFLAQAMLYSGEPMRDSGTVYVAMGADLPEDPCVSDSCAIVSVGPPPEAYLSGRYNCIALEAAAGQAQALNELQRIFSQSIDWRERLYSALYLGEGIQAIVNESQKMFDNPVYVHDSNYRIIAYAENRERFDRKKKYGFLDYGRLSVKTIQALNRIPGFSDTFLTSEPTYWEKTDNPVDRFNYLYSNIFINGEYSGRIFVDERVRPISRFDYIVLDELTAAIELFMQRRNSFGDQRQKDFNLQMVKILEKEMVEPADLEDELSDMGWGITDAYSCFLIRLPEEDTLFNVATGLCDMLESNIRGCQAIPYKDHIVVIANISRCKGKYEALLGHLRAILVDFNLRAGGSLVFNNLIYLRKHYKQAMYALKYGEHKLPDQSLHLFEAFTYDYILNNSLNEFSAEMLCPKALLALIAYDKENRTAYTETLRAYLECDSSPSKTIAKLYLHRSTLLYRLNRIQELIAVDLADLRTKLHLLLACGKPGTDKK